MFVIYQCFGVVKGYYVDGWLVVMVGFVEKWFWCDIRVEVGWVL